MKINNDFTNERVPNSARASLFTVTMINIGIMATLSQFLLGATLGHSMTFSQAMLSTAIGSAILSFIGIGLGIIGAREGLTTSLLIRYCGFGNVGSTLVTVAIIISLLGWFGIQNSVFANALNYLTNDKLGFSFSALLSGIMLTVMVSFGFRVLGFTAIISIPLFFIVTGCIACNILNEFGLSKIRELYPSEIILTVGEGATIVAGGYITAALTMPDISRYCINERHAFWMVILSIIVGEFIINGFAVLISQALNTEDIVTIMTQVAGWLGLASVILSTIKINNTNLYSSTLSLACITENILGKRYNYIILTIILGVIGTLLYVLGILEKFTDFLTLLGVIFLPITGIILCDYYFFKKKTIIIEGEISPSSTHLIKKIFSPALISSIAGVICGLNVEIGIQSINSLVIASVLYCIITLIVKKRREIV
ncbi:Cytosine/purine/uracil/thiamine/allantoin permease family protein [Candidatus Sodalis pierantonius str. SOPE]|uniref:Cytosine/purine/uracil/thiamine/allantoin permease family protein n=2 Tax=Sodalis TaxID=84565 RepID=W0HN20_9GAMM|nr:Cytosine/purine/uracil/thiamine/allantoin permease family protein [Candidatus Sodalis pierantonius str. SOPE]